MAFKRRYNKRSYRGRRATFKSKKRQWRPRRFKRRTQNNNMFNITCPIEEKFSFVIDANKEWSNKQTVDLYDLKNSPMFDHFRIQYDQWKCNSVSVVLTPCALATTNNRYKVWSLADPLHNTSEIREENDEIKNATTCAAMFRNNPNSKQSLHIAGAKSMHRHYLVARGINERTVWNTRSAFYVQPIYNSTGAIQPAGDTIGTSVHDAINPNGFMPAIKIAVQRLKSESSAETVIAHATIRFNITFKGFKYPIGFQPTDSSDATLANDPTQD